MLADELKINSDCFIEKLKQRDKKAVTQVVELYHKGLIRGAQGKGLSTESADDVVAETWKVFFEKVENFQGRSQIKTFLYGIMFNKVREYKRILVKNQPIDDPNKMLESNFLADGSWAYQPSDPEKIVEVFEISQAFTGCLEELNKNQKQIFFLKEFEGLSYNEICDQVSLSISNLKVSFHRARNQVRRCMEGYIA